MVCLGIKLEATGLKVRMNILTYDGPHQQCDQIGRFIRLWATF